jgi:hypothetical protein
MTEIDEKLLLLNVSDNVLVACETLAAGSSLMIDGSMVTLNGGIELGHKIARLDLPQGTKVSKYGAPIGSTTEMVKCGQWLHTHNMRSDYIPTYGRDVGDQPMTD